MAVDLKKIRKIAKAHEESKENQKALIVTDNGNDVIFNIGGDKLGVWKGTLTSKMARDHDGRKVLRWMLDKEFDREALDIIQLQLDEVYL